MALATLSIDLVAKLAQFESDMGKAAHLSQQTADKMTKAFNGVRNVLGALGIAATVAELVSFTNQVIEGLDALATLNESVGSTVEKISALEDVAAKSGTTFETVGDALLKFNKSLTAATPNSEMELALRSIGLQAKELKQQDPSDALLSTARALSKFADDGEKARLTQILFGKSLREVAPFLNDLAKESELVAKVTTEEAEAAKQFNDQLSALKKNSTDSARAIVSDLLPTLNRLLSEFKLGKDNAEGFIDAIAKYGISNPFKTASERITEITAEIERLQKVSAAGGSLFVRKEYIDADIKSLNQQLNYYKQLQIARADYAKDNQSEAETARLAKFAVNKPKVKLLEAPKETKDAIDESTRALGNFVEELQKNLQVNKDLTNEQKALNFLTTIGYTGQIAQVRELVLGLAQQLDAEKKVTEAIALKREEATAAGDAILKANEEYQTSLKKLLDATPSAKLEEARKDMKLLTEEFEAGRISESQYLEAVSTRLDLVAEKTKDGKTLAEDLGLTFSSAFEDAILNGSKLSDVLAGLGRDIERIILRKSITEPIGNWLVGAISGFSLFNAKGNAFDASGLQAFAKGGTFTNQIVDSPTVFKFAQGIGLMGEAGPEAIMPLTRAKDGSLGVRGGGSNVVVNVIEAPGQGGQQTRTNQNGTDVITVMVEKIKTSIAGDIVRGSGQVPAAMSTAYGLNRVAGAY